MMNVRHRSTVRCLANIYQIMKQLRSRDHISFRLLTVFIVLIHVVLISGCTTTKQTVSLPNELQVSQKGKIVQIILITGEIVKFDHDGGIFIETVTGGRLFRAIVGITDKGNAAEFEIDRIQEVRIERQEGNVLGTVVLITVGVPAALFSLIMVELTIHPPRSCPYLYSFDGERYVFDGQSYAGAISRGLKRTDHTRLDFLKPVNGMYHLLFRNDPPDETQYTDEVKLLAIDHDPKSLVAFGYDGRLYSVENLLLPLNVAERNNGSVTSLFAFQDGIEWHSNLPKDSSYKKDPLRDQLTFSFPKPRNARIAAFCIYGGSDYWGSRMIQEFVSLRGNRVYDWYRSLQQKGPELKELFQFIEGQELYHLSVNILEGNVWGKRSVIRSGSSLADEYRVLLLDISRVQGDTLTIRLNPPRGFWKFDYTAISYHWKPDSQFTELNPIRAEDEEGKDIRKVLIANDEQYHIQKKTKDTSKLWFTAPQQQPGTERSLFLKTNGFYIIHTDTSYGENTALLQKLLSTDSAGVEYALDEYLKQVKTKASTR